MRGLSEVVGNFPVQIKYLVVGGFNTVVGYGWFALCYALFNSFLPYLVIVVVSHLTATSFSFLTHHQLVFSREGGQSVVVMWVKFQYSSLGMMLLGLLMNFILFNWLGLSPWLSQLVAMLVGAGVGFFVHRYFVFASKFRT